MKDSRLFAHVLLLTVLTADSGWAQMPPLTNPATPEGQTERTISLFADGNVQSILNSPDGVATATGSIGVSIQYPFLFTAFRITAVGTDEEVSENFGAQVLTAQGGGVFSGLAADIQLLPRKVGEIHYGGHGYIQGATSDWQHDNSSFGTTVRRAGLLLTLEYRDSLGTNNPLTLTGDVGLAHRSLAGDLARESNLLVRDTLLGTEDGSWNGLEAGLTIQLHQISARGVYYHFGGNIDGFSGGQIVTSISIKSPILSDRRVR